MNKFDELFSAAEIGDLESVKKIIKNKPSLIHEKGKWDFAIMHAAVMSEDETLNLYLIEAGANVNARNDEGITPLHLVLYPEVAQLLIDKGAEVNAVSNDGSTPLHTMAAEGDQTVDVVEVLIENGANKTIKNNSGETALDIATQREEFELMDLLK